MHEPREGAGDAPIAPSTRFLHLVFPAPTCAGPRVAHTITALLTAFVGKDVLKGKKPFGKKDRWGESLPPFYFCQRSCAQCSNSTQCPGEAITAGAGLGCSPLHFPNTVTSSWKSAAVQGKVQSGFPAWILCLRKGSGASLCTAGNRGATPVSTSTTLLSGFYFSLMNIFPRDQTMRRKTV